MLSGGNERERVCTAGVSIRISPTSATFTSRLLSRTFLLSESAVAQGRSGCFGSLRGEELNVSLGLCHLDIRKIVFAELASSILDR